MLLFSVLLATARMGAFRVAFIQGSLNRIKGKKRLSFRDW